MPTKQDVSQYRHELRPLIMEALQNDDSRTLEKYITERSNLPGPRGNTRLIDVFGEVIAEILTRPDAPAESAEKLLIRWSSLSIEALKLWSTDRIAPAHCDVVR